ncbi:sushi, von Willebrand factor type A, EGF and pentraxin domain-containing protein 1-like, partial [Anneissia japonica]|uniref:sushi, von Willebrand factor type A, EGF and pentraxin domain-containing protein 1-like n=1 Tax=Anneissia japonica TaxID=1529436 RepID=UPI001425B8BF
MSSAIAYWDLPTTFDNCCDVSAIPDIDNGTTFGMGPNTVTYTAVDCNSNGAQCTFIITVEDCEPPMIMCPDNVTIDANDNCTAVGNWSMPTATDIAVGQTDVVCSHQALISEFEGGSTKVMCNATDGEGNTGSCSFYVDVVDTTAPEITCPLDSTIC